MDFEPLNPFTVDFADRVASINNANYSGITKLCKNMDLIHYWRDNAPHNLSDIDYRVISALLSRSIRRIK